MKNLTCYQELINCNSSEKVFEYFIKNLSESIQVWNYYVNWGKIKEKVRPIEVALNTLNYLIGKDDIESQIKYLFKSQPSIIHALPILIAVRQKSFKILEGETAEGFTYKDYKLVYKPEYSDAELSSIVDFFKDSGIMALLKNRDIKSVPDYVFGVEVGLDSNGRKGRGGIAMESLLGSYIQQISSKYGFEYLSQANSQKVKEKWDINLRIDEINRRFDFVIYTKKNLFFIETNYYTGGGSKLKATAGEFRSLSDYLTRQGFKFIWVTDGAGWRTTVASVKETFNYIDYLINLRMCQKGILDFIIGNES